VEQWKMDVAGSFPCSALDGVGWFAWMGESLCSFSSEHRAWTSFIAHDNLQKEQSMGFSFV
jgi:hypothetical protein